MNVIYSLIKTFPEIKNLIPIRTEDDRTNITFCFSNNYSLVFDVLKYILQTDSTQILHLDSSSIKNITDTIQNNIVINFDIKDLDYKNELIQLLECIVEINENKNQHCPNYYILIQGSSFDSPPKIFSKELRKKIHFNLFDFTSLNYIELKTTLRDEWESNLEKYEERNDFRVRYQSEKVLKILDLLDYDIYEFDQIIKMLSVRTNLFTRCSHLETREILLKFMESYINSKEEFFWNMYLCFTENQKLILDDIYINPGQKTHKYFASLTGNSENTNRQSINYLIKLGLIRQKGMFFSAKSNANRIIVLNRKGFKKTINLIEDFLSFGDATYRNSQLGDILEEDYFFKHKNLRKLYKDILRVKYNYLKEEDEISFKKYSFLKLNIEMSHYKKGKYRLSKEKKLLIEELINKNHDLLTEMLCYNL